jgi:hypothetical protein
LEPVLRDASTIRLLWAPEDFSSWDTAVSLRYHPPLELFAEFLSRTGDRLLPACELFSVLVADGMPVLEAFDAAGELA